jgi:hypothetical protein
MSSVEGFLLRTSLGDTGAPPRSGTWTNCLDICIGGAGAIAQDTLIQSYDEMFDNALTQGQSNNIYVRAKNMNSAPPSQEVFLFQFPNSLILKPDLWYAKAPPSAPRAAARRPDRQPGDLRRSRRYRRYPRFLLDAAQRREPLARERRRRLLGGGAEPLSHLRRLHGWALAMWIYGNGNLGWRSVNILAKP